MKRTSGVLMHVSSLPGQYSSGSFGKEAYEWIDFLAESGFSCWQVLPFCIPDEYNSPYKSNIVGKVIYMAVVSMLVLTTVFVVTYFNYKAEYDRIKKESSILSKKPSLKFPFEKFPWNKFLSANKL